MSKIKISLHGFEKDFLKISTHLMKPEEKFQHYEKLSTLFFSQILILVIINEF